MSRLIKIEFERDLESIKGRLRLGLCCINTQLRTGKIPVFCSRTCIRKNFTVDKAKELALKNVQDISTLIKWNENNNIQCLRLSSDLFPHFTDTETEKYTIDFAKDELQKAGELATSLGHRILMHPGQYNQVGAKSADVFQKTIDDLSHHANILDSMNINDNGVLIVHGGGTYGDKENTIRRWIEQFDDLPRGVKNRLVLENCERQYSTRDCLNISEECNIPVVFDFHHYQCYSIVQKEKGNDKQEDIGDLLPEVIDSWKDRRVVMHVSEQGEGRLGHHSDYIDKIPDSLLEIMEDNTDLKIDLEVEAKMKEKAIKKLYKEYKELF
jgi:UV DNA damage endonuclease